MKWTEIERFILEGRALDPLTGQVLLPTVYDGTVMAVYKLQSELASYVEESVTAQPWFVIRVWMDQDPPFFDMMVCTDRGELHIATDALRELLDTIKEKDGWLLVRQRDNKCGVQRRLV